MNLNLGCGLNKLDTYINVDIDASVGPDLVHDFTKSLPYEMGSVDRIVMFHVIEHLQKRLHMGTLLECRRVLKPGGELVVSFPEFSKVVDNWKTNYKGLREFWEATIYGRQLSPSDYHVCIMDSAEFSSLLIGCGFRILKCVPEITNPFNTVIKATPDILTTYSGMVKEALWTEHPLVQEY